MVKPLAGFVLVKEITTENKVGDLIISEEKEKRSNIGEIVLCSIYPYDLQYLGQEGIELTSEDFENFHKSENLKKGDKIIYRKYSDYETPEHQSKLVEFKDIIGIIEEQNV